MGMYFAGNVAKQYDGSLKIRNKEKQGAIVVFEIKLC